MCLIVWMVDITMHEAGESATSWHSWQWPPKAPNTLAYFFFCLPFSSSLFPVSGRQICYAIPCSFNLPEGSFSVLSWGTGPAPLTGQVNLFWLWLSQAGFPMLTLWSCWGRASGSTAIWILIILTLENSPLTRYISLFPPSHPNPANSTPKAS